MTDLWGHLPSRPDDPSIETRHLRDIDRIVVHTIDAEGWTPEKLNALCTGLDATPDDPRDDLRDMRDEPYCSYHDYIRTDGEWYHLVDYHIATWHARGWNTSTIGVAIEYRARPTPPPPALMQGLVRYLGASCYALGLSPRKISGHRELIGTGYRMDGGVKHLIKNCPGMAVDLDRLRRDVMTYMGDHYSECMAAGGAECFSRIG